LEANVLIKGFGKSASENPINGKTLHKGRIARIMASYNRIFMAKQQNNSHTLSKETSNAPPQCPRHQIKA